MAFVKLDDVVQADRDRYELQYHYTSEGLFEAERYLFGLSQTAFAGDRTRLEIDADNCAAERDMCRRLREAFWARQSRIQPPTPAQVQQASTLADQIDAIIATGTAAGSMVDLATRLFQLFNGLNRL